MHPNLNLICASRFGTCVATMTYAGSLPFLLDPWAMTATEAGSIQAAHNLAYALSLLVSSWLADRIGARRVFLVSVWASAIAFCAFAAFARSYGTALVLFPLVAVALGGTYTPAIMLVAGAVAPERRGAALGRTLAAASAGYVVSLALSTGGTAVLGHEWAFAISAAGPLFGAVAGTLALKGGAGGVPAAAHRPAPGGPAPKGELLAALASRSSLLLTIGYTAHCWELMGMWAWAPAFLTAALTDRPLPGTLASGPLVLGLVVAATIHVSGMAATLTMGAASDRWGRRGVLIAMAAGGATLSFTIGWGFDLGPGSLLALVALYGFTTLGDSGVLSTAMTEAVPARHLGTLLALRSLLGFGAGAASPIVFGWVLDSANPAEGLPRHWGWAFAVLGAGGAVATLCALLLPSGRSEGGRSEGALRSRRAME